MEIRPASFFNMLPCIDIISFSGCGTVFDGFCDQILLREDMLRDMLGSKLAKQSSRDVMLRLEVGMVTRIN